MKGDPKGSPLRMKSFAEACYSLKEVLIYDAECYEFKPPMALPEHWSTPGLNSNLKIGESDLSTLPELIHDFSEIDISMVIPTIERIIGTVNVARKVLADLKKLAPGVVWGEVEDDYARKLRLFQVMELGRRAGCDFYLSPNEQSVKLTVYDWSVEVVGPTVFYGPRSKLKRLPLRGNTRLSWWSAMHATTGGSRAGYAYLSAFRNGLRDILPKSTQHVDLLCRVAATANTEMDLTRILADTFDAPEEFSRGGGAKYAKGGIWKKLSDVVDTATTNPIAYIVRQLKNRFPAEEVYRLFGQLPTSAGGPFPAALRDHFLDVLADLEGGVIRSRMSREAAPAEDGTLTLEQMIAIQESFR